MVVRHSAIALNNVPHKSFLRGICAESDNRLMNELQFITLFIIKDVSSYINGQSLVAGFCTKPPISLI